jgi:DNA-directed RNA polymerase subunit RPC12/RpoP
MLYFCNLCGEEIETTPYIHEQHKEICQYCKDDLALMDDEESNT